MSKVNAVIGVAFMVAMTLINSAQADDFGSGARKFQQLNDDKLAAPNVYRNADGAPGPQYWQQRADYKIQVKLDEKAKYIKASETITYTNNAPTSLRYLWVQLDQNRFKADSLAVRSETAQNAGSRRDRAGEGDSLSYAALRRQQAIRDGDHGYKIMAVKDASGKTMQYTIVDTMMRIDLPRPLRTGQSTKFSIDWGFNIIEEAAIGGRGGYEHFDNETYLYFLAQWFPRMAAYTDYAGWQHKAFLGRGEFTLEFGDYDVEITVPADHIVSATGRLQNADDVLTKVQRARLKQAETSKKPVFIVTPEEAKANEAEGTSRTKTWRFKADNVRDFAWSSSRKYIWDAQGFNQPGAKHEKVMAMSFYPNEAEPIWSRYSTPSVIHTMEVYSRYSFPYPYPTAQSVNTWERGGMEYPMITFNGRRPTEDEKSGEVTYSRNIKYGLVGVIIHEVGHTYFPMTVNSDERQWTWMDEGINTFLEYLAELEWEENFPAFGGKTNVLDVIPSYMTSSNQVPIMTQSDSILQFGPNGYVKPAAAFTVLRETVMGRELFDHAFREYARRWMFKRPTPSDFFRTMEDASGVDLDWFWRGWFYSTDYVDVSIDGVRSYQLSTLNPDVEDPIRRQEAARDYPEPLQQSRNRQEGKVTRVDRYEELKDFYNENDEFTTSNKDRNKYASKLDKLEPWERAALEKGLKDNDFIYFVDFSNKGGLVSPIPLTLHYKDGSSEDYMIPAEIWRRDANQVTKLIMRPKEIVSFEIDRHHQTADADFSNNYFPQKMVPSRLELFKRKSKNRDLMADMLVELKSKEKESVKNESANVLESASDD
ncbi:MAG: M1 family metallopeptidase [Sphingomonadales bacterium]|jgi:hypothetical protein